MKCVTWGAKKGIDVRGGGEKELKNQNKKIVMDMKKSNSRMGQEESFQVKELGNYYEIEGMEQTKTTNHAMCL